MKQDVISCPYCGSELIQQNNKYFCDFCVMTLKPEQLQQNYERISVRVREFAVEAFLKRTTPELMEYSTFELLSLLKYARAERTSIYHYLTIFHKAQKEEFKEMEKDTGKDYEWITRKMFVVENLIRQRLGFVPSRITDSYLAKYLDKIKKEKNRPMIIRQQRTPHIK